MSVKLYAIFGILLIVAVVLITSVNDEETGTMPASPHPEMETADPLGQAPSRENVSAGVKQTMDHLRQVIAEDPQNGAAMLELATMLQNAHNPGEAAMLYERGLAISPENTDARIDYSLCLFQLGPQIVG